VNILTGFAGRRWRQSCDLARWLARRWPGVLAVLAVYAAGLHCLGLNLTASLPYTLVWIEHGRQPVGGELMIYRFAGQPLPRYGYIDGARFFKRVGGMPGEAIRVVGRDVFVGERHIGWAKARTRDGQALAPIAAGTIPAGYYFAQSDSVDSFDSRYAQSGLVAADRVIGVARVLF
jgi:conjugal transfer pilin signal peptidase TrbI